MVDVPGKLVHVVVERIILFLRLDESICDFLKRVDTALFFDVAEC